MKIKIKTLSDNAVIPTYAKNGDAGLDLTAAKILSNTSFEVTYGTDLAIEIPKGFVGFVFPRSSIMNYELSLSNSVGVIDSGYRGEIKAVFNKLKGLDSIKYNVGDRICQLIIIPYPQIEFETVNELSETERGAGGYGSTNK